MVLPGSHIIVNHIPKTRLIKVRHISHKSINTISKAWLCGTHLINSRTSAILADEALWKKGERNGTLLISRFVKENVFMLQYVMGKETTTSTYTSYITRC
jgi:hypothetical protein